MSRSLLFIVALGFIVFCIGGLARTYMNLSLNKRSLPGEQKRRSTELRYKRLMKEHDAPAWPLFVAITCMPLGIVIIFFAIAWSNHIRLRPH
jgi:hypothetical protein